MNCIFCNASSVSKERIEKTDIVLVSSGQWADLVNTLRSRPSGWFKSRSVTRCQQRFCQCRVNISSKCLILQFHSKNNTERKRYNYSQQNLRSQTNTMHVCREMSI